MRLKNKEWKKLFKTEPQENFEFPESLQKLIDKSDVFRSCHGTWYWDMVWYKGDNPETATAWTLIVDDGSYFKHRAEFSFWHTSPKGELVLQCVWSFRHLKKTLRNYLENGVTLMDPNYQT